MWLIHQNAILIKDNLLKRKWKSDPKCCFCPENESFNHLFFECSMAKFVWSLVALVVGADCRSPTFAQFWVWVQKYMANGTKFHMVGLSAICWALWRARNNICLRKKKLSDLLLRSFVWLHRLFYFGQNFKASKTWRPWKREEKPSKMRC